MSEKMITITESEYDYLVTCSDKYECLRACGVDNWDGWGDAMEMFEGESEE